ncbi:GIY-YIG nuclease family protein [Rhodohalobacter mucosus]|uniref:Excinuclease ABC subunit C n=1 Tax=Rhodohalobacter mucosus TaxID=2079485 RepID=A0A316TNK0_9BACT|nr:GIY-YIG nuclease family protein [Rhodohalobacter mucosus]PWN05358.1 excinuclease ABC subunit C [Rhodohalobacter mucosus]
MYYAYIIYSPSRDTYYKGHTSLTPQQRLERHNDQWTVSTRSGIPWDLTFYKSFETKTEAIRYELFLKKQKNRAFIESLISSRENEFTQ